MNKGFAIIALGVGLGVVLAEVVFRPLVAMVKKSLKEPATS